MAMNSPLGNARKGVGAFYYPILKIRDNNSIKVK
jgi:hypothetical protein